MTELEDRQRKEQEFHDRVYASGEYEGRPATRFYTIARAAYTFYEDEIERGTAGKDVLEYGCGQGSYAFTLAKLGARVTGIDISKVGIEQADKEAEELGLSEVTEFEVMDAESLRFEDSSFDVICGGGILHHLDLEKGYAELARTLRPDGRAVFLEAMGHNPLINAYRNRTPEQRTEDEHPLLISDLERARHFFGRVEPYFFHLMSLIAIPLRRTRAFDSVVRVLDAGDRALFRAIPGARKHAWMVCLVFSEPRRAS